MTLLSKLFAPPTGRVDGAPARKPARRVDRAPRTQDQVLVAAAQDDMLILRDYTAVAAVAISSVDDTLLSEPELEARLLSYRNDLLKRVRFDFQVLIGTRPQNLELYLTRVERDAQKLAEIEEALRSMAERLEWGLDQIAAADGPAEAVFAASFGFSPFDVTGIPGGAREAARLCCDPDVLKTWREADAERRAHIAGVMREEIEASGKWLAKWQDLIWERAAFVEETIQRIQAPVRTIYFVVSHRARPIVNKAVSGPLTESELAEARRTLDERCDQIARGIQRMKLGARRVSADELIEAVRHFYNPTQTRDR
ncbi:MAG: hypothetical protein ACUVSX_15240 [Aggregatilineales bacterium]